MLAAIAFVLRAERTNVPQPVGGRSKARAQVCECKVTRPHNHKVITVMATIMTVIVTPSPPQRYSTQPARWPQGLAHAVIRWQHPAGTPRRARSGSLPRDRLVARTASHGAPPTPRPGGQAGAPGGRERGSRALEGAARPGRHYTAVGRGASLGVPEGVPAADAPGEGTAPPQSALCSALPPALEPMDWRQLRSSVRQRWGSGPGKGPRGRLRMGRRMSRRGSVCEGDYPGCAGWGLRGRSRRLLGPQGAHLCGREDNFCPIHLSGLLYQLWQRQR